MSNDQTPPNHLAHPNTATPAASGASDPMLESCDWCGSTNLWWRNCKLLCRSCSAIVKSCADL